MFGKRNCEVCAEKEKQIELLKNIISDLKSQNKDLSDRFMSLNERAFLNFKAETRAHEPLYPVGVDSTGKQFSYKDSDPEKTKEEIQRAFGEEVINVEDEDK